GDVVGQTADIDRGDSEAADLTAASRVVEPLDGCSPDPESRGCAADQSARALQGSGVLVEDGVVRQLVGGGTTQCGLVGYAQGLRSIPRNGAIPLGLEVCAALVE